MRNTEIILLTGVVGKFWNRSIGAYQLAGFLRNKGYTVQVIDFVHKYTFEDLTNTVKKFISADTKFIGLSTTFLAHEPFSKKEDSIPKHVIDCLTEIKQENKSIKIIAGGAKSNILENNPLVDHIVKGYGEYAFLKLLEDNCQSKIIDGDKFLNLFDVKKLTHFFNDNDCILKGETLPIEVSRGCIFKCKFCSYPLNGKKKLDHLRDVELVKQELIHNYNKWGTTNYYILDDTFNDNNEKLKNLHKMIMSLPFKISFVAYLRLDLLYTFKEQQLEILEEMGLKSCHFGIESFNVTTAKFIGKGFNAEKSKDFLLELKERWAGKINFMCTFIAGLPFESKESCLATGKWCNDNNISFFMMPLAIRPEATYKSDIDLNYSSYGYKDVSNGFWKNDYMTSKEALDISTSQIGELKNLEITAWNLFAILSAGIYNIKDLYGKDYTEIDMNKYQSTIDNMFKQYQELVKNV